LAIWVEVLKAMEDEMNVHGQLSIASIAPKKTKKKKRKTFSTT